MPDGLILIAVENKMNGQLLQDTLRQFHNVRIADSEASLNEPFDLGLFDGVSLKRFHKQVLARQQAEPNLFLPILLVTTRQDISMVTGQLWKSIDEIIFAPIEKRELLARVEVLLRAHNYSVEL
ncbi:MAG: hybrid sensor histidine kinase/response regulator, partial [Chloroflexota bacterium]